MSEDGLCAMQHLKPVAVEISVSVERRFKASIANQHAVPSINCIRHGSNGLQISEKKFKSYQVLISL